MKPHLDLDDAIDRVAKRLTHVDDDALFAARIVASLPEPRGWFGWVASSWMPGLAMIAIVATIAAFWSQRQSTAVNPAPVLAARFEPMAAQSLPRAAIENVALVRTRPLERLERLERLEPSRPDHDRSLQALSVDSLAINSVATAALPAEASLSLPSLQVTDLPLTTESFPQK